MEHFRKHRLQAGLAVPVIALLAFMLYWQSAPAQEMPYPKSTVVQNISFDLSTRQTAAPGSDNWPVTWADDDHQYTSWGDGGGFGGTDTDGRVSLGVGRIEGLPSSWIGRNIWGGKDTQSTATLSGKSHGVLSIGGVLYMWVSGDGSETASFKFQRLYRSTDHGRTWSASGWEFNQANGGTFFCLTFLQFGKDYQDARDGYVYAYAPEIKSNVWDVQMPGEITLMRAPKTGLMDRTQYEFFAGSDANGNPTWTANISSRKPVWRDATNGAMRTKVNFNKGLNRYFLLTQQVSRYSTGNGHIGIYDAPSPWGPWTTALFTNAWTIGLQTGSKSVGWNFSNKWTSGDGRESYLVYTDNDSFGLVKATIQLSASTPPPTATATPTVGPGHNVYLSPVTK